VRCIDAARGGARAFTTGTDDKVKQERWKNAGGEHIKATPPT